MSLWSLAHKKHNLETFPVYKTTVSHFILISSLLFQVKSALRFPRYSLEKLDIGQSCRHVKRMRSMDSSCSSSRSYSRSQGTPGQRSKSSSEAHTELMAGTLSNVLLIFCRKRRCKLKREDSAASTSSSSSSSSSSVCSPQTPSSLRPCPSSPSLSCKVLQVPYLDSLSSIPLPSPPQHEQEWKQVREVQLYFLP